MKKSRSIVECSYIWIYATAILLGITLVGMVLLVVGYLEPTSQVFRIYLVIMAAFLIFSFVWGYYKVINVIRKWQRTCLLFNNGYLFDEFFHNKYSFSKEMDETLLKIEKIIDKQASIKESRKHAEYLALQNQINPHFLYNTLEAIRADALSAGMSNIAQTTEALATFFRYTITEVENLVTLEDELNNIENYFIIQKYRFGNKLKLEIDIEEDNMEILQACLPKLTLQPIVENAIRHGLETKVGGGTVTIQVENIEKYVFINVIDDGSGIKENHLDNLNKMFLQSSPFEEEEKSSKIGGIALPNVNARIKLLFGEEYGIHIFSTKDLGTNVRITLPFVQEKLSEAVGRIMGV